MPDGTELVREIGKRRKSEVDKLLAEAGAAVERMKSADARTASRRPLSSTRTTRRHVTV
jgi:hypothetical protein